MLYFKYLIGRDEEGGEVGKFHGPGLSYAMTSLQRTRPLGKDTRLSSSSPCTDSRSQKSPPGNGTEKDSKYLERRRRNNLAAKKSRDARKAREDQVSFLITHNTCRIYILQV